MVDTLEAVRDFHLEAMNEAIERMKPEMMAASEAVHRMKDHDDPSIKDLDRTVELGSLVADLVDLCAPHLHHIAKTLAALKLERLKAPMSHLTDINGALRHPLACSYRQDQQAPPDQVGRANPNRNQHLGEYPSGWLLEVYPLVLEL